MLDFGFYNMDCLEGMRQFPDNYFELAIVDPPYGDGGVPGRTERGSDNDSTDTSNRVQGQDIPRRKPRHKSGGGSRHYTFGARKSSRTYQDRRNLGEQIRKKIIAWDVAPDQSYFDELFRVSRNQVIWGGELFPFTSDKVFPGMAQINYIRKI